VSNIRTTSPCPCGSVATNNSRDRARAQARRTDRTAGSAAAFRAATGDPHMQALAGPLAQHAVDVIFATGLRWLLAGDRYTGLSHSGCLPPGPRTSAAKAAWIWRVMAPGRPSPMAWPSISRTGVISVAVPVRNTSLAE
jgi:hypothetical protein